MTSTVEDFPVVGSYNNQRFSSIDAERSVNLFEYIDPLGKKPRTLIVTPGLVNTLLSFTGTTGGFRNRIVFNGIAYVVIGPDVWSISPALSITKLNPGKPLASTPSGYVGIDANTFQIIFVDGASGWIYDTTANTFIKITDPSFPANPIDVCYLDGFFVVAAGNTNTFELSSLNQGLVWGSGSDSFIADPTLGNNWLTISNTANFQTGVAVTFSTTGGGILPTSVPPINTTDEFFVIQVDATHIRIAVSYANAIANMPVVFSTTGTAPLQIDNGGQLQLGAITSHPGTIVACRTLHRRLFLFSQFFTEVWENNGSGANLPFRRNNSILMEYGTSAIASIDVSFDRMIFLSQARDGLGSVMMVAGTESIPISTEALDFQLTQYAKDPTLGVADARGIFIKDNGIIFYRLNFTLANHTFVYNLSSSTNENKLWHEEEVLDGNRHPAQVHIFLNGNNYYGHYSMPILYRVDDTVFTNDGEAIRRMRITKAIIPPNYKRVRIDRYQLDLLQGNVALIQGLLEDTNLLTETGFNIDTENSLDILLEQSLFVANSNMVPEIFLSISKDGGQSYGYVLTAPMGSLGQRRYRTLFRKLGVIPRGQAFVSKIEFYDAYPLVILGAAWGYEILPE